MLLAHLLLPSGVAAFVASPLIVQRTVRTYQISGIRSSRGDDDSIDMEAKIRALNKMIGVDDKRNDVLISTSKRKRNLEREIELLSQLHPDYLMEELNPESAENNIIQEFWNLWYGECGASNAKVLRAFEEELVGGGPESWPEAEREYLRLIDEHCDGGGAKTNREDLDLSLWIEPANRLATLYYMMGRLDDSKLWCERILDAKPWHIGALSGIILVCMQLKDKEGVMKWASKGMPRLSEETLSARKEWVERNVELAEQKLYDLEKLSENYVKITDEIDPATLLGKSDHGEDLPWQ